LPSFVLLQYVLGAVWFSEVKRINDWERIKWGGRGVEGGCACVSLWRVDEIPILAVSYYYYLKTWCCDCDFCFVCCVFLAPFYCGGVNDERIRVVMFFPGEVSEECSEV
jgi:hypothetical protein